MAFKLKLDTSAWAPFALAVDGLRLYGSRVVQSKVMKWSTVENGRGGLLCRSFGSRLPEKETKARRPRARTQPMKLSPGQTHQSYRASTLFARRAIAGSHSVCGPT
jgi:hypothetical protein